MQIAKFYNFFTTFLTAELLFVLAKARNRKVKDPDPTPAGDGISHLIKAILSTGLKTPRILPS
jgi:hypothetical protein